MAIRGGCFSPSDSSTFPDRVVERSWRPEPRSHRLPSSPAPSESVGVSFAPFEIGVPVVTCIIAESPRLPSAGPGRPAGQGPVLRRGLLGRLRRRPDRSGQRTPRSGCLRHGHGPLQRRDGPGPVDQLASTALTWPNQYIYESKMQRPADLGREGERGRRRRQKGELQGAITEPSPKLAELGSTSRKADALNVATPDELSNPKPSGTRSITARRSRLAARTSATSRFSTPRP